MEAPLRPEKDENGVFLDQALSGVGGGEDGGVNAKPALLEL